MRREVGHGGHELRERQGAVARTFPEAAKGGVRRSEHVALRASTSLESDQARRALCPHVLEGTKVSSIGIAALARNRKGLV